MFEDINKKIIEAMKSKDVITVDTLRMLKGAILLEEINKKKNLSDDEIISIINKQIKLRKDSLIEFEKYGRKDLAEKNILEIEILNKYLPVQLSLEEIDKIIDDAIITTNSKIKSDFSKVMGIVVPILKNKTDMSKIKDIIVSKLD